MTQKQKILLVFTLPAIAALLAVWLFVDRSHQQLSIERWSSEHRALVRIIANRMQEKIDEASELLAYTGRLTIFHPLRRLTASIQRLTASRPISSRPNGRHWTPFWPATTTWPCCFCCYPTVTTTSRIRMQFSNR
jgi:hypothetical protein